MITSIEIDNFTVFEKVRLSLSPRINVIIGSNGTGKTHLLKAIYGLGLVGEGGARQRSDSRLARTISSKFLRVFSTEENHIGILNPKEALSGARLRLLHSDNSDVEVAFGSRSRRLKIVSQHVGRESALKPIFIPTKEILSLVRGIRHPEHDRRTVERIFDDGYIDLAELIIQPAFDESASNLTEDPRLSSVIRALVGLLGGRYRMGDDGGFRFEPGRYEEKSKPKNDVSYSGSQAGKAYQDSTHTRFVPNGNTYFSSGMTAEGYRKIGMLNRLLSNGSINPGVTGALLWDEPEANLNPKLMQNVVRVLLELSRNGQQVILATHDYVLLKWLDLLMDTQKEDHIRFHAIYQNPATQRITIESADSYSIISKTAISDTFAELFDKDLARALGERNP
jgi:predicted ATPase